MSEGNGIKTFDDLHDALAEKGTGARKCDRCRQVAGGATLGLAITGPRSPDAGNAGKGPRLAPDVKARLCESCAVQVYSVVAKAVGQL